MPMDPFQKKSIPTAASFDHGNDIQDIYTCYNEQEADRIVEVLQEAGVQPLVRDTSSSILPFTIGHIAPIVIAVPLRDKISAQSVIANAIADGVLPQEGNLMDL